MYVSHRRCNETILEAQENAQKAHTHRSKVIEQLALPESGPVVVHLFLFTITSFTVDRSDENLK